MAATAPEELPPPLGWPGVVGMGFADLSPPAENLDSNSPTGGKTAGLLAGCLVSLWTWEADKIANSASSSIRGVLCFFADSYFDLPHSVPTTKKLVLPLTLVVYRPPCRLMRSAQASRSKLSRVPEMLKASPSRQPSLPRGTCFFPLLGGSLPGAGPPLCQAVLPSPTENLSELSGGTGGIQSRDGRLSSTLEAALSRLLAGGEVVAAGAEGDASGEGAGAGSGVARFCAGDDRLAEASVAAGASFLPAIKYLLVEA
mmetsp:Transcript_7705/g.14495  ORF Transcript_7705/g.14495 Transcript_7705/m.14495 type:complete len:257 (+) Transcript_7705:138-908(+)